MATLLVLIPLLASICCCKSIECLNGGIELWRDVCICRPGTAGQTCAENVTNWTKGKNASQSTIYALEGYGPSLAIDGMIVSKHGQCSLTKLEWDPWWRVHLGVIVKVGSVFPVPYELDYERTGFQYLFSYWDIWVGITTLGEYQDCRRGKDGFYFCKGAPGHIVVVKREFHTNYKRYVALCEILIYGSLFSDSPCLSNPCGNGGSCEPKETGFYMCVCPHTWPGINCEGTNWARGQNATVSGPDGTVVAASNTVDGSRDDVMRHGNNIDNQCVTTTSDVTSPWWKVELGKMIEVTQVYMVNRVHYHTTFLTNCDIVIGSHSGAYTKCVDRNSTAHARHYRWAWLHVWCIPVAVGSTVEITYKYQPVRYGDAHSSRLSLCEVEVYGIIKPCASNPCSKGGTCHLVGNTENKRSYICSCPDNSTGSNCNTIDPCSSNPCDNGGTCKWNETSYTCFCTAAWTGRNCELKKKVKGMPIATNVLIIVGISFGLAAAGAAILVASGSRSCSAASAAHTGDLVSTLGVVTTLEEEEEEYCHRGRAYLH